MAPARSIQDGRDLNRNQFFYSVNEQYGTGRTHYEDIGECVGVLLRLQADHENSVLA